MKKEDLVNNLKQFLLFLIEDEKAPKTLTHYEHVLNEFISAMPDEEITKIDMIQYKQDMIDRFKPSTVNSYILAINKYIKYLEIKDTPGFNAVMLRNYHSANELKKIRVQNKTSLEEVMTPSDLKRMLNKASRLGRMDIYYIMKIMAYTGIRVEELKAFTYENIQDNYIRVRNKGKSRTIILRNDLRRDLLKYCDERGIKEGYLFPGRFPGKMIHTSTIFNNLKMIAGKCSIKKSKVHAHSFRHLFAIKYIEDGGNIADLADILGHSDIQTTRIYLRTTEEMKKKKLESMKY